MKTTLECLPCYLRQALQVARISTTDPQLQLSALRRVAELTSAMDMEQTPPENSISVYRAIAEITGCPDPYLQVKEQSNKNALSLLPGLRHKVKRAEDSLALALRLAIGGNIIDYGAMRSFDIDAAMECCVSAPFAIDDSQHLLRRLRGLGAGERVLYLADNAGEIVYDSLVVDALVSQDCEVTVVVKSGPIINDALVADAHACGLEKSVRILENGTACPGTPLDICSHELIQAFNQADLIISKGQGNFETLSESEAEIYFLLTVKCSVVGAHLAAIAEKPLADLPGRGELVLFHHKGNSSQG
jgi:damage-control phosphatase, subfamily I